MIRELKTFLAVVRHGAFAKAAKHIGLTQSAVSAQVHRLEEELGFQLFDRTARAVRLNEQGQLLAAQAETIVRLYGQLGASTQEGGRVIIGAIESTQSGHLVDALEAFHSQTSDCRTRIVTGMSLNLLGTLDSGEVDLVVMVRPPFAMPDELVWLELSRQPFMLVVPLGIKGDDWRTILGQQPFIRWDRSSFSGRMVERFIQQYQIPVNDVIEMNDRDAILSLVSSGVGVALLPVPATRHIAEADRLRCIPLGEYTFYRDIGLAYSQRRMLRAPVRTMMSCIKSAFQKDG